MIQVIPFGERQFLVRLFATPVPEGIVVQHYYRGTCRITGRHGHSIQCDCIAHRPAGRRNVFAMQTIEELILLVQTDLPEAELAHSTVALVELGRQLSEGEAKAWLRPT